MTGSCADRHPYTKMRAALLASVCVLASCSFLPAVVTLNDELPRETDVPGWEITGQYRTGSMKKIGRMSPLYAEYDPAELAVSEYCRLSDTSRTIRVELVRFNSPLDSFGLYSRERGLNPSGSFDGDSAYSREGTLYSHAGRYYLKITGRNLDGQESDAPGQFRSVVLNNLDHQPGDEILPDSLFVFSPDRSTRDIVYYKNGVAGIPGMKNVSVMRRLLAGKNHSVIYAKMATAFDAEQEFNAVLKTAGSPFMLSRIGSIPAAVRIVSDAEYLLVSHYKQWIFGVMDADTMNEGNKLIIYLYGELRMRAGGREKS